MSTIDRLSEYFEQFPGIGPRQAKRFVYFLLTRDTHYIEGLSTDLKHLKNEITLCSLCRRFFAGNGKMDICVICRDANRSTSTLMLVEKDVDLENVERSGAYQGQYFVLGDSIPILEKDPEKRVRANELLTRIKSAVKDKAFAEVVLAFSNTPEGDNTTRFITELLTPLSLKHQFKITTLGRGLSTGTELEYSDKETIKNALQNRK